MSGLQKSLERIWDAIPLQSTIFYLDYPMHLNIGDLLINAGTEQFFKTSRYTVNGRLCFFDICDWPDKQLPQVIIRPRILRKLLAQPKGTIFVLHGGGNLGDIYPELNAQRLALVERLADYRVVIMPQSLHFRSAESQRSCLEGLLAHPDLHLFLRDEPSLAAVREISPGSGILCADMAHALWSSFQAARAIPASAPGLVMYRRDSESAGGLSSGDAMDWDDLVTPLADVFVRAIRKIHFIGVSGFSPSLGYKDWYVFRDWLIQKAVRYFSRYREVTTDRLHGMILAALLGKSTTFTDNTYGKLSRYHALWLRDSPLLHKQAMNKKAE